MWRLIFLIVGATTMFSKKTCGLPSGRPRTNKNRRIWNPPLRTNIKIRTYFVGDDILGVPFVRHNATISLLQWEKVPRNEADEEKS